MCYDWFWPILAICTIASTHLQSKPWNRQIHIMFLETLHPTEGAGQMKGLYIDHRGTTSSGVAMATLLSPVTSLTKVTSRKFRHLVQPYPFFIFLFSSQSQICAYGENYHYHKRESKTLKNLETKFALHGDCQRRESLLQSVRKQNKTKSTTKPQISAGGIAQWTEHRFESLASHGFPRPGLEAVPGDRARNSHTSRCGPQTNWKTEQRQK